MKNITLNIDDRTFSAVIKYAADHGCSVNSLVSEYFIDIANREYQVRKARLEINHYGLKVHSLGCD